MLQFFFFGHKNFLTRIEKMKKREELLENLETKVEDIEEEKSIMKQERT